MSLPESSQKSYINAEPNQFSNTGSLYHQPGPYPQASSPEGHYTTAGCLPQYNGQDILELHHAMEYHNSRRATEAVDMSHVTSTVENTLRAPEAYLHYA